MTKWPRLPAILTLACLCAPLVADDRPEENSRSSRPARLAATFSTALDSSQLKPGGRLIGGATATQCLTVTRASNLGPGDELRAVLLTSLDLESGKPSDATFGIEYGNETSLLGKAVGGYTQSHFGDRLSAGYQHWELREEVGETASDFVYGRWDHFSRAEWSVTAMYGFSGRDRQSSGSVEFRMTDSWTLPGTGRSTRLIPLVGVAYGVNWFGSVYDGTVMTLGLSLRRRLIERVGLGLNLEGHRRLSGDQSNIPDRVRIGFVAEFAL